MLDCFGRLARGLAPAACGSNGGRGKGSSSSAGRFSPTLLTGISWVDVGGLGSEIGRGGFGLAF